jgi:hypothetical protein
MDGEILLCQTRSLAGIGEEALGSGTLRTLVIGSMDITEPARCISCLRRWLSLRLRSSSQFVTIFVLVNHSDRVQRHPNLKCF